MTPKEKITVSLVQPNVHWEERTANLLHLSSLLASVENTDLIVLPEMFPTGFSMRPQDLAEEAGGVSTQWMAELAQAKDSYVVGSIITHAGRTLLQPPHLDAPRWPLPALRQKAPLQFRQRARTLPGRHRTHRYRSPWLARLPFDLL